MDNSSIGDRMKTYEEVTRFKLTRRGYTVLRIDGKAFHTFTKGLVRPFDDDLMEDMDSVAAYLCKNIQSAKFAYVQSDEISILITDFDTLDTQSWFDNNLQKMCSISASLATSIFNKLRYDRYLESEKLGYTDNRYTTEPKLAHFDSRVFQLPSKSEVANYFLWRQQDTVRNSISSVAQSMYSPKQLHGKDQNVMQEMIFQKDGTNWNNFAPKYKRGRIILKETYTKENTENSNNQESAIRTRWVMVEPPIFSQDKDFLSKLIPENL